ncbi:hypothetical protein BGZ94_001466 [Podila epigama]|nr:hypothetical protein BGZ94_001466 [Podila epigama]
MVSPSLNFHGVPRRFKRSAAAMAEPATDNHPDKTHDNNCYANKRHSPSSIEQDYPPSTTKQDSSPSPSEQDSSPTPSSTPSTPSSSNTDASSSSSSSFSYSFTPAHPIKTTPTLQATRLQRTASTSSNDQSPSLISNTTSSTAKPATGTTTTTTTTCSASTSNSTSTLTTIKTTATTKPTTTANPNRSTSKPFQHFKTIQFINTLSPPQQRRVEVQGPYVPSQSAKKQKARKLLRDRGKIKRSSNCFIRYRTDVQPEIVKRYGQQNNKEISRLAGIWWKNEAEEVKSHYRKLAQEEKEKHALIFPNYKYTPSKTNTKKAPEVHDASSSPGEGSHNGQNDEDAISEKDDSQPGLSNMQNRQKATRVTPSTTTTTTSATANTKQETEKGQKQLKSAPHSRHVNETPMYIFIGDIEVGDETIPETQKRKKRWNQHRKQWSLSSRRLEKSTSSDKSLGTSMTPKLPNSTTNSSVGALDTPTTTSQSVCVNESTFSLPTTTAIPFDEESQSAIFIDTFVNQTNNDGRYDKLEKTRDVAPSTVNVVSSATWTQASYPSHLSPTSMSAPLPDTTTSGTMCSLPMPVAPLLATPVNPVLTDVSTKVDPPSSFWTLQHGQAGVQIVELHELRSPLPLLSEHSLPQQQVTQSMPTVVVTPSSNQTTICEPATQGGFPWFHSLNNASYTPAMNATGSHYDLQAVMSSSAMATPSGTMQQNGPSLSGQRPSIPPQPLQSHLTGYPFQLSLDSLPSTAALLASQRHPSHHLVDAVSLSYSPEDESLAAVNIQASAYSPDTLWPQDVSTPSSTQGGQLSDICGGSLPEASLVLTTATPLNTVSQSMVSCGAVPLLGDWSFLEQTPRSLQQQEEVHPVKCKSKSQGVPLQQQLQLLQQQHQYMLQYQYQYQQQLQLQLQLQIQQERFQLEQHFQVQSSQHHPHQHQHQQHQQQQHQQQQQQYLLQLCPNNQHDLFLPDERGTGVSLDLFMAQPQSQLLLESTSPQQQQHQKQQQLPRSSLVDSSSS